MNKILSAVLGLPFTLWLNFRYLPFKQARYLPIILAGNVRIRRIVGQIIIDTGTHSKVYTGMIRIGFHCVEPIDNYSVHTILCVEKSGKLKFLGSSHIGKGAIIHIAGGTLILGDNFAISGTTSIVCKNKITIGKDVQLSYNGLIIDSDAHKIYDNNGNAFSNTMPIAIDDHVWIAPNVTIQKGSHIPSNSVVASNSLVNKCFSEIGSIIGGIPAKVLKHISNWEI